MNLLKVEFYKLRHRKMGLMVMLMGLFQFCYLTWATGRMDSHEVAQGWKSCLYLLFQTNIILMPLFIATIASRLSDIEHKGNTFKCLKTMVSSPRLFNTKILCGSIYLIAIVVFQVISVLAVSTQQNFLDPMPIGYLAYYIGATLLMNMTLFLLQLNLSLVFVNQMIAFVVAVAGTFLGLYSMFFSGKVAQWILWGYYALLSPIRMDWDQVTHIVDYYWTGVPVKYIVILICIVVALYVGGKRLFIRREQ